MSLGLVSRHTGGSLVSLATEEFPSITLLLNRYADFVAGEEFVWSTITINDAFASARHRDSGNQGPSYIAAFGEYSGGKLWTWPGDKGKVTLGNLSYHDGTMVDPRDGVHFDGTQAHETVPFKGWRVSVVWFMAKAMSSADGDVEERLRDLGFRLVGEARGLAQQCRESCARVVSRVVPPPDKGEQAGPPQFTNLRIVDLTYGDDGSGAEAVFSETVDSSCEGPPVFGPGSGVAALSCMFRQCRKRKVGRKLKFVLDKPGMAIAIRLEPTTRGGGCVPPKLRTVLEALLHAEEHPGSVVES